MRTKPFSRPTLIGAVELLEGHSQARFNEMVLRLGLLASWRHAPNRPLPARSGRLRKASWGLVEFISQSNSARQIASSTGAAIVS